jgi:STE24 endopeptidase
LGYVLHIVLALAAVIASEQGLGTGRELPWAVLVPLAVPHTLAWIDRKLFLRGRFRLAGVVYASIGASATALYAALLLVCGWSQSVARWTGTPASAIEWPEPSALLVFAPFVVYTLVAIDARVRIGGARDHEAARQRRFQVRLFLSSVAPFAVLVVASWAIGIDETVRAHVEHVQLWGGAFAAALILATMLLLPTLLRRTWDTQPIPPGPRRELLTEFARRIGFRCRELVQWNTGFQMSNAAVVGIGASRVVLFSDLLLAQLPERELLAVFAHEIGHVVRHHVVVFVAWSIALFLGVELSVRELGVESEWVATATLAAALVAWYFAFGWYSRRVELEADLHSVATTGDVEAMVAALERVGGPHSQERGSWRHFSTSRRVEFLLEAVQDPRGGRRLVRQLRWIGRLGLVLSAIAIAAQTWSLWKSLPADRVTVELALGRYETALERSREVEGLDEETFVLVQRAAAIDAARREPGQLREAAELARDAGRDAEALDLYYLATLRGERGLDGEIEALESRLRTGSR